MVEASFMGAGSGEGGSWTASFDVAHPMLVEKKRERTTVLCVLHDISGADREETTQTPHQYMYRLSGDASGNSGLDFFSRLCL
jgi:hypothetical protein